MNGNQLSLGRNHSTADVASIKTFGGEFPCARVDLRWNDGAYVYVMYDTRAEAEAHMARLGYVQS